MGVNRGRKNALQASAQLGTENRKLDAERRVIINDMHPYLTYTRMELDVQPQFRLSIWCVSKRPIPNRRVSVQRLSFLFVGKVQNLKNGPCLFGGRERNWKTEGWIQTIVSSNSKGELGSSSRSLVVDEVRVVGGGEEGN